MRKKRRLLIRCGLLMFCMLMLIPCSAASAKPNVMDDLTPESDLPDTSAPVVKYDEYPIENYDLDIYAEDEDEGGILDAIKSLNPWNIKDEVIESILAFQQTILSGLWYGYTVVVNSGLYFIEQAFTFDLIGSMIGYIADLIAEIGGPYGIGQFMGFMLILTSAWLVYTTAKKQFRHAIGGLLIAALLSGFFTLYVQNSESVLGFMNDKRLAVSNAVLSSSTYSLDSQDSDGQVKGKDTPRYTDAASSRYGLSRIRNLLHDLLIVKPYMLMEFGSTNLAVVGGAKSKNDFTQKDIDAGKEKLRTLLKAKPGSDERKKFIKENLDETMFSAEYTNQRTVLSFLIWVPAVLILAFAGLVSFLVQIYSAGFLIQASIGVFIIMAAIMPTFRSFASQWALKLLNFLAMSVAFTFSLILMFSLVNIVYKVAEDKNWNYLSIVTGVAIVVITMIVLSSKLWGYQIVKQNLEKAREFTQKMVQNSKEQQMAKDRIQEAGGGSGWYSPGRTASSGSPNRLQKNINRLNKSDKAPIKGSEDTGNNIAAADLNKKADNKAADKLLKNVNSKKNKKDNRIKKQPGHKDLEQLSAGKLSNDQNGNGQNGDEKQPGNKNQHLINHMQKKQADGERIKQQPGQKENENVAVQKRPQGEEALQRIRRQEAQEKRRIHKQPQTPENLKPENERGQTGEYQTVAREKAKMKAMEQRTRENNSADNIVQLPRRDETAASSETNQQNSHSRELDQMRKRMNENKGE
ncbi:CD3337/EF1877 family mobilome membrane protein [Bacillus atrophaeus]|uniref:CD3337/EF1877 family mobilome membrane protein n=1 Tax=Bacillus atrophaeus TaxID=1452 RepID=UPI002E1BD934|nr:hypothetical protein [Bacillus atrophaeus]MED1032545.1 hypothetical protein [Bacillus atrophaeus]MED1121052.1 hypothetical protein [Bacillus atrophaeus]